MTIQTTVPTNLYRSDDESSSSRQETTTKSQYSSQSSEYISSSTEQCLCNRSSKQNQQATSSSNDSVWSCNSSGNDNTIHRGSDDDDDGDNRITTHRSRERRSTCRRKRSSAIVSESIRIHNNLSNNNCNNNNNNNTVTSTSRRPIRTRSNASSSASSGREPIQATRRRGNSTDEFTIDKLRWDTLMLVGRDKEEAILKQALEKSSLHKQLILISGVSGCGKSALARTSIESKIQASSNKRGLLVEGKFDLQGRNVPFSGITAVGNSICGHIYSQQYFERRRRGGRAGLSAEQSFSEVTQSLYEELGSDLVVLTGLIPLLEEIVVFQPDGNNNKVEVESNQTLLPNHISSVANENNTVPATAVASEDHKHRFQYAFRRFLRVIAKHFQPLAIVFDDLHWADLASLDLLEVILTDWENDNLLMIGTYRSNEIDDHHPLTRTLQALRRRSKPTTEHAITTTINKSRKYEDAGAKTTDAADFFMQEMEIGDLRLESIHQLVQHILAQYDEDGDNATLGLAQLCYKRTHGNAFFLRHFLTMLYDEELLKFNFGTLQWHWDVCEIEQNTQASANVVDFLTSKLADLPQAYQDVIQLASCLGTTFEVRILLIVYDNFEQKKQIGDENNSNCLGSDDDSFGLHNIQSVLESLVASGYLEPTTPHDDGYTFSHDKVREAVSSMIPENNRRAVYYRIGEILIERLDKEDLEDMLFVAVDLLNEGMSIAAMDDDCHHERIRLAELNCRASRKAVSFPAFASAADFASKGIAFLPKDDGSRWGCHRQLVLESYAIGAKAEAFLGHSERVDAYTNVVISQPNLPVEDKLDAYIILIDNLAYRGKVREACKLGFDLLAKFDCKFPKTKLTILYRLVKSIGMLKRLSKSDKIEQFQSMSADKDRTRRKLLFILDHLSNLLHQSSQREMACLVSIRMTEWTMQYGLNDFSPIAMARNGVICTGVLNEFEAGLAFAKIGLSLCSTNGSYDTKTLFLAHAFVYHWTTSLRDSLKPLLHGYELAIRCGETEYAGWSMLAFIQIRFMTGCALELIVTDLRAYTKQMKDFDRILCYEYGLFYWEVFDNLMGHTGTNIFDLWGNRISKDDLDRHCDGKSRGDIFGANRNLFQGALYCIYGEYEECANLSLKHGQDEFMKKSGGRAFSYLESLTKGLSCYAAARLTGNRNYRKHANAIHNRVKLWASKGNPNVRHHLVLLDAEKAALHGKKEFAIKTYQNAIMMSARGGFLLEAGLSSERLAALYLEEGHADDAKYRLEQSCNYYSSFGAHRKVLRMLEMHSDLLQSKPSEITMKI